MMNVIFSFHFLTILDMFFTDQASAISLYYRP